MLIINLAAWSSGVQTLTPLAPYELSLILQTLSSELFQLTESKGTTSYNTQKKPKIYKRETARLSISDLINSM
jgi:hypothetical protein